MWPMINFPIYIRHYFPLLLSGYHLIETRIVFSWDKTKILFSSQMDGDCNRLTETILGSWNQEGSRLKWNQRCEMRIVVICPTNITFIHRIEFLIFVVCRKDKTSIGRIVLVVVICRKHFYPPDRVGCRHCRRMELPVVVATSTPQVPVLFPVIGIFGIGPLNLEPNKFEHDT